MSYTGYSFHNPADETMITEAYTTRNSGAIKDLQMMCASRASLGIEDFEAEVMKPKVGHILKPNNFGTRERNLDEFNKSKNTNQLGEVDVTSFFKSRFDCD
jgi:hypothetical protein